MGKIFAYLLCVCACVAMLPACNSNQPEASAGQLVGNSGVYKKISADKAREMMGSGEPYVLLDVRTEKEYAERRIAGAILIPDTAIGERTAAELPDKSVRILVYCRTGRRSAKAANELAHMGYTNVFDMGGINDWPFDTVSN